MRDVIEQIVAHPQGVDAATLAEIQRYAKLFWINNGPYNNLTARKFVLKMHAGGVRGGGACRGEARRDIHDRARRIARRRSWRGCSRCSSTRTSIRSSRTRRPAPARTSCSASANNLYSGVSMADLKGFTEKYGLNSRLVKTERQARRGGLPHRRPLRQSTSPRSSSTSKPRFRLPTEPTAKALARWSSSIAPARGRSRGLRHRLGPGQGVARRHHQRLHRGLPRSARHQGQLGRRSSSTSTRRRRSASRSSPTTRSGSRTTCRGTRSTARPTSRASSPTPSTSSSRPAIPAR